MKDITQVLSGNSYPGRGILLGTAPDGNFTVAYFIMGRSENSRNRVFVETEGGIRTQAFDPTKMADPSLIIYHPVRRYNGRTIVTNGDQTDTVFAALKLGGSFESALRTRRFEPDAPHFTPRISGIMNPDGSYGLSILKSTDGGQTVTRQFFEYESKPGVGHFIHTYLHDGNPLPSFCGEPTEVAIGNELAQRLWDALDADNRVSLFVSSIDPLTQIPVNYIINKNVE